MRTLPFRALLMLLLVACLALSPVGIADEDDPPEDPLDDSADGAIPFAEQIDKAIDLGVKWLLAKPTIIGMRKGKMATWGLIAGERIYGGGQGQGYGHPAGPTALALYTLLKCGVDPKHPIIEQGFNWLREPHRLTEHDGAPNAQGMTWSFREARGSYELSAEILALTAKYDKYKRSKNTKTRRKRGTLRMRDKDDREWLQDLVAALLDRRGQPNPTGPHRERLGWRYNLKELSISGGGRTSTFPAGGVPPHANQDLSSTQLATLALYAAHQFGARIPLDVWLDIAQFTMAQQEDTGPEHARHEPGYHGGEGPPKDHARGFCYIKGSPDGSEGHATGSMTGCGVANLLMVRDVVNESRKGEKRWKERNYDTKVDTAIHDGLAWLDLNWSPFDNPKHSGYHIYYLYAVERSMDIVGKQLLGKHVWYREGAMEIVKRQQKATVKHPTDPRAPEMPAGFWNTKTTHKPKDVLDTCFALLFLKRATRGLVPVVTGGSGDAIDNR